MKLTWCLLVGLIFTSCHDEYSICEEPTEVRLHAGFYTNSSGTEQPATAGIFTITLLGSANTIYNQQPSVSKFLLTLNPSLASAQYIVVIQPGVTDTVTINYTTQKVTISDICPEIYVHGLSSAVTTTHYLKAVSISNSQVNTTAAEHLKLFL